MRTDKASNIIYVDGVYWRMRAESASFATIEKEPWWCTWFHRSGTDSSVMCVMANDLENTSHAGRERQ